MSRFAFLLALFSLLTLSSPLHINARKSIPPQSPSPSSSSPSNSSSSSSNITYIIPPHLLLTSHPRPDLPTSVSLSSPSFSSSLNTSSPSPSSHTFHTLQADEVFSMVRLCQFAPWSPRIQPAILPMYKQIFYTQSSTQVGVSTGSPWLILFEGSLSVSLNNSGILVNENDVWASADGGRTWDLVAGISRFGKSGYVASALPYASFTPRGGANNCEDPDSDYVFSIGGYFQTAALATNQVWYSSDGKSWIQQDGADSFVPNRFFSSCDLDSAGHIYTIGGVNSDQNAPQGRLLNDVWSSSIVTGLRQWRRLTTRAPWAARAEHLVLVGNAPVLQKEIIYVIGGMVTWENGGGNTKQSNDVWASSDGGYTWIILTGAAAFPPRWGHGGLITKEGVLLVFGGADSLTGAYEDTYQHRDVHASFDGGITWTPCNLPATTAGRSWIRTEQGLTVTDDGHLILAAGYSYEVGGRPNFNDVWRSTFPIDGAGGAEYLARICNAVVPRAGIGLRQWRGSQSIDPNLFTMSVQTRRAPWSARASPALLLMQKPITYKQAGTRLTVSTTPNWLLMYEGALSTTDLGSSSENDVWASADNGETWDLISGVSINGAKGYMRSEHPDSSFPHRARSNNCEDPSNDDVYSVGGLYFENTVEERGSNDVWFSSDAMQWTKRSGVLTSFVPARYDSSCDIDTSHVLYIAGGRSGPGTNNLLNDVWAGTNQGRNWNLATARAPWRARAQHLVIIYNSVPMGKTLLYVMGGISADGQQEVRLENDVWVSSDGGAVWAVVTVGAPWNKRWGHTGAITENGVMVIIGGTTTLDGSVDSYTALRDLWVSLDGGYTWSQCNLPTDHGFIRGQMGTALTLDQRLILASGYSWQAGGLRTDFTDLWISNISIANAQRMSDVCGGYALPSAGLGLRVWPGTVINYPNPTLSALAIAGIVSLIIVVFGFIAFCYWSKKTTGRYPVPAFLQPSGVGRPQPVGNGDYFVPGTGGSVGGGGFGSTGGKARDAFSSFESGGSEDYHPPNGGYQPPGSTGHHAMLS